MIEREPLNEQDKDIISAYISLNKLIVSLAFVATTSALLVLRFNPPDSLVGITFFIIIAFLLTVYNFAISLLIFKKKKEGFKEIKRGMIVKKIFFRNKFTTTHSIRIKATDNQLFITFRVSEETYKKYLEGDTVKISFLNENPKNAIVIGSSKIVLDCELIQAVQR